ncbi:YVTN repeat-like/Quino protein amine dehydrogenase [Hypoxylon rubiginosum]|uniref:YVTN repeat-like/Quino protein amine dehydrogenase n=1 Tax=Hypoxylon rubiginosum TaxID=110542 RepID=A0ACB9Z964_9PEZI|nr:YVTN repeat-like/Quino protein amine dehydrogenase [Hypoxylon rubiginosum]
MRPPNSPPVSPFHSPDRPQIDEDVSPLFPLPPPQLADSDPYDLHYSSMNDYPPPPSLPAPVAYAGPETDHGVQHGDDDGDSGPDVDVDHDMLDVDLEEGGVSLNLMNMDDHSDHSDHSDHDHFAPYLDDDDSLIVHQDSSQTPIPHSPPVTALETPSLLNAPLSIFEDILPPQLPEIQDPEDDIDPAVAGLHPMALSNANPMSLGPENPHVMQFLELWEWQSHADIQLRVADPIPSLPQIRRLARDCPRRVEYKQLRGDEYDFQGINWKDLGVARNTARRRRMATFHNYVNRPNSDSWHNSSADRLLRPSENYFRYKSMDIRRDVRLLHFQLRNILGVASRTRAFYPSFTSIREHDPTTGRDKAAMRFDSQTDAHVSTLTASEDILIVGGFYGTYRYRHLDSPGDLKAHEGQLTNHISNITNHVQIHSSRHSSTPLAAFASNDYGFRVVDLATNRVTSETMYDFAMNCTALSPDMRLRVMVGDHQNVLITDAETGEVLQDLEGHRDFGFACDWAPDGWTVATGNQDRSIRIWDARKWKNTKGESTSVAVVRTEMAGARSLRFSPLGSGKRILVAAEEADFVNLIDAQTFNTRQTVDIFGELGGVAFTDGGDDLIALSCDLSRGGVMRLERCDAGAEDTFSYAPRKYRDPGGWWRTPGYDWMQTPEQIVAMPGSQGTLTHKRRQSAMLESWTF